MAAPEPKQNTPKTLAEIAVMYNVTEKEIVEYSAEDLQELLTVEFSLDPGVAESITSEVQEKGGNLVYVDPQYTPAGAVMDYITLEEENAERRADWEAAFGKDYGVDTGGRPKKQEGAGRKKRKSTKRRKSKKRKSKKRKSNKRKTKRKKRSKRH